jgi:hypothetical protein
VEPDVQSEKMITITAETAAKEPGLAHEVKKVTEIMKITDFGVMTISGLAVDVKELLSGRIPSLDETRQLLSKESGK